MTTVNQARQCSPAGVDVTLGYVIDPEEETRCQPIGLFDSIPKHNLPPILWHHLKLKDRVIHQAGFLVVPVGAEARARTGGVAMGDAEISPVFHVGNW